MSRQGTWSGAGVEDDFAANMLERRWFASMAAARAKRAECEALLQVVALAKASWHESCAELMKLEALRDALAGDVAGEPAVRQAILEQFPEVPTERLWSAA